MNIYFLRALTEYISIVLCLHKVANKKFNVNISFIICFVIDYLLLHLFGLSKVINILLYVFWFAYTYIVVTKNLKLALKSFGIMIITIPTLQLVLYAIIVCIVQRLIKGNDSLLIVEILINSISCVILQRWKKQYIYSLGIRFKGINAITIIIMVGAILVYVLYRFKSSPELTPQFFQQMVVYIVIWGLTIALLENAEMEKKHKAEELQLYEQYTNAFKDALTVIKMKQHEFDNHINAIQCMQYVIEDKEELAKEQKEYCENVIKENMYNKVLLLKVSPILAGYLYSKFTIASSQGIHVKYIIQEIKDGNLVSMNDLIEIIGILFDNAVEALVSAGKKHMQVNLYYNDKNQLVVEVSNESEKIPNAEQEKFFKQGYSTKGEDRGMGLYRLNSLRKKYKADLCVDNIDVDTVNYFRLQVVFGKKR